MLIVEGADNVGKSTLIKQLLEIDPTLRVLHRERFKPSKKSGGSIGSSYLNALLQTDDRLTHANSIADRLIASEVIYGDLFRGGHRLTSGELLALDHVLTSYQALVIVCDAPDEAIRETWQKRAQTYDDPIAIATAYRQRVSSVFPHVQLYSYNWKHAHADFERIRIAKMHRDKLTVQREALAWWAAHPYGIGQLVRPQVLIVGESPSPKATTGAPFAHGPAGDFLAWTISRAETRVGRKIAPISYVTNADKGTERDAALLREEIRFLQPAVVVALGNEATELAQYVAGSTPVESLPHPMFWKRFRWERRHEYTRKFIRALRLPDPAPELLS